MSSISIPNDDPTTFCRVCFADINLLILIQPGSADETGNQHLLRLVKTYLQLEFGGSEDFSCAVCELCYRLLQEFDILYKNAQQNNEALKMLMHKMCYQSTAPPPAEEVADVQETTLVEIIEPSSATEEESYAEKDIDSAFGDNLLDGQILLEEVPCVETNSDEHQVHVFHLDGEWQHVIISGESSDMDVLRNSSKAPATGQPTVAIKPNSAPDCRPLRQPTSVPRPPHKLFAQSINSLKSEQNPTHVTRQKQHKSPTIAGQRERDTFTSVTKKLYRCNHCPSLFVEQSKYYDHNCIKQQPRSQTVKMAPFRCGECNVSYRRELYWQKHLYEVHGICSENFGITCSICQLHFSQKQDYQLHVLAMH